MTSVADKPATGAVPAVPAQRTPREVIIAISGLVVAMFVAVISGTVVSTSMPLIIADLGGDQTAYTWVITASLLAMAVSTPIWGKLADLVNRKVLLMTAIGLFVVGTAIAGFAQDTDHPHRRARDPGPRRGRPHVARHDPHRRHHLAA